MEEEDKKPPDDPKDKKTPRGTERMRFDVTATNAYIEKQQRDKEAKQRNRNGQH